MVTDKDLPRNSHLHRFLNFFILRKMLRVNATWKEIDENY